jgi:tRNA 2-thiouridine synthesizing protein E
MLHIVNKSPGAAPSLASCLRVAQQGHAVILIEDGVYAATPAVAVHCGLQEAMKRVKVYVLQPDLEARHRLRRLRRPRRAAPHQPDLALRGNHSMGIEINGTTFETDEEGYLVNLADWNEDIANVIAKTENVDMTPNHWEVVNFLRDYYNEYQIAPAVRVLTKAIGKQLGPEKGNSKYLYELFPYGPAKQACKIAGLPKPTGCV